MNKDGSKDIRRLKSEALNEFALRLATATTIEEIRGIALKSMRQMLDLIYPEAAP